MKNFLPPHLALSPHCSPSILRTISAMVMITATQTRGLFYMSLFTFPALLYSDPLSQCRTRSPSRVERRFGQGRWVSSAGKMDMLVEGRQLSRETSPLQYAAWGGTATTSSSLALLSLVLWVRFWKILPGNKVHDCGLPWRKTQSTKCHITV